MDLSAQEVEMVWQLVLLVSTLDQSHNRNPQNDNLPLMTFMGNAFKMGFFGGGSIEYNDEPNDTPINLRPDSSKEEGSHRPES